MGKFPQPEKGTVCGKKQDSNNSQQQLRVMWDSEINVFKLSNPNYKAWDTPSRQLVI